MLGRCACAGSGVVGAFAAEAWLAGAQAPDGTARAASSAAGPTAFVCPMHPDYILEVPGSCPRCGMALVKGTPFTYGTTAWN